MQNERPGWCVGGRAAGLVLSLMVSLVAAALPLPARAAPADDAQPLLRHRAPVTLTQPAAFVQLPLPAGVYALICYLIHGHMVRTFDATVRRMAGQR